MSEGRRKVILIAASEFPEEPSLQPLRCPKNDVAGLAEALTSPDFGLFTNPLAFINQPCHSTLRAINRVFKEAGRDDQILIYYSGHGKLDAAGHLHLATSDTEASVLETSSIAVGTLRRLIDSYACKQVALILDCCFGGAVSKDFLKSGVDDHLKQTFHGRGIYILTASTATQTAREKEGDDYSLFTKHILQGIRQGEADHDDDGLISLDDLYEYVKTRVPKEAPQYPTKWEFGVQGNSLFIARAVRMFSPERLRAFKQRIKEDEDDLMPEVFEQAYRVIRENQPKRDKDFFALLEELCDGRVRRGEFNSRWLRLGPARAPEREKGEPPPPQEEEKAHVRQQQEKREPPSPPENETELRTHKTAQRFARSLISEIKLYNAAKVNDGRRNHDLYDRLKDEIDRSRKVYDERVSPAIAARFDYFYDELAQVLAEGDPAKLGKNCPGPVVLAPVAPMSDSSVPSRKPVESFTDDLNGVPLEMIFVSGGAFKMGSPEGEGYAAARPQHEVTVHGFFIGKYQITQAQWEAVMGNNPSYFKGGGDLPIECVSWHDAKKYCKRLSQMTSKAYRLPSEAEWEYACRAGTTGDYAGDLDAMAWYSENSGDKTHPVGQKQPNAFGLHDMHGNVWEWCEDIWHNDYSDAPTDGSAWLSGEDSGFRALRGGSWHILSWVICSAIRLRRAPGVGDLNIGFRVAVSSRIS